MTPAEIDAMEPGMHMDRIIARAIGCSISADRGWFHCGCERRRSGTGNPWPHGSEDDEGYSAGIAPYSTDIRAAVEACGRRKWNLLHGEDCRFWAKVALFPGKTTGRDPKNYRRAIASADAAALALARALLKAIVNTEHNPEPAD